MRRADRASGGARDLRLLVALVTTGMAALAFEVIWSRALIPWVGGTAVSQITTVAMYMFGLFVGSSLGTRFVSRIRDPRRAFLILEGLAGLGCALAIFGLPLASPVLGLWSRGDLLGSNLGSLLRGITGGLWILPSTTLMGFAFPLAIAAVQRGPGDRSSAGVVYGLNTLGATLGAALGGFVIVPLLGVAGGSATVLAVDLVVVLWAALGKVAERRPREEAAESGAEAASDVERPLLLSVVIGGFVSLGLEVLLFRFLGMILGPTARAFTVVLVSYVLGLGVGALAIRRQASRGAETSLRWFAGCWVFVGVAGFLISCGIAWHPEWVIPQHVGSGLAVQLRDRALAAGAILLPLTCAFGASYPLAVAAGRGMTARRAARIYAALTCGNIAGLVVGATVLLPRLGIETGVALLIALAFLTPVPALLPRLRTRGVGLTVVALIALAALPWVVSPRWDWKELNSAPYYYAHDPDDDWQTAVLSFEMGFETTVAVLQTGSARKFSLDGKVDGSDLEQDQATQCFLALLPVAVHPAPRRGALVGLGTGQTACEMLRSPMEEVVCAELSGAVVRALPHFESINQRVWDDPRFRLLHTDARTLFRYGEEGYDIIVSEPSNVWVPGVAHLFTREAFAECRQSLEPGGVLVQWLHTYVLGLEEIRTVVRTLLDVFPHVTMWTTAPLQEDVLFLSSMEPLQVDWSGLETRIRDGGFANHIAPGAELTADSVLGNFIAGTAALREFAGSGPLSTDARPSLEYAAERAMLEDASGQHHRLLSRIKAAPTDVITGADGDTVARLERKAEALRSMHSMLASDSLRPEAAIALAGSHPDHPELRWALAERLATMAVSVLASGRPQVAQSLVTAAKEIWPENVSACRLAIRLDLGFRRHEQARRALEELAAIPVVPRQVVLVEQGGFAAQVGRWSEAADAFDELVALNPYHLQGQIQLARCELELGRRPEAQRRLRRVLEIDPGNRRAQEILGDL